MKCKLKVTNRQKSFIDATESEVLFGGASGGGKSYGQLVDALLYAMKYPNSKQLILRRTLPELEKSLIRTSLSLYPKEVYSYHASSHTGRFANGSLIDFGYCATENDVYQYQSAEYDVIRFDELTHFTEGQYVYLLSRLRGAVDIPRQVKSSTNPGGIGHAWVKARFIDPAPAGTPFVGRDGLRRVFLPARIEDNTFLMRADPMYRKRLSALPEREKRALLYGEWDIFDGQYFPEFSRRLHVSEPFTVPASWRKYRTIDYGLDRLACLWIALSPEGCAYVYREYCESNLPIGKAAEAILSRTPASEEIYATLAPPDLFSRSQETGKSKAVLFSSFGVTFTKTSNNRESGWLAVKELLAEKNGKVGLKIFSFCTELIRCLPALQIDRQKPSDCANEPHEITHAPDALRGFAVFHTRPAAPERCGARSVWTPDMWEDYEAADDDGRNYLLKKYGEPI